MAAPWQGAGLALRSRSVTLTAVDDALLADLAVLLPDDLELDPAIPLPAGDRGAARRAAFAAALRQDRDRFRPEGWKLHLAVRSPTGRLVGLQTLEAEGFARERTVDSASWLVPAARGQGVGTAMREAVLAFAFGTLGAEWAVSSAWHDNAASLGVSRRLGYRYERTSRLATPDRDDVLLHLRLDRRDWLASERGRDVVVSGADPAMFGAVSVKAGAPSPPAGRRRP
ncbi:MAG: GNAT family N-acetyltransferase [Amnibacterium sp.]